MGNLHSAITERVQHHVNHIFDKAWFTNIIGRFRRFREDIYRKMLNFWGDLQFQQEPAHLAHEPGTPAIRGPMTRRRAVAAAAEDVVYRNPRDFREFHDRIEVYNNNEMKLVYFVCGINFFLLAVILRYLFI